ncbi:MAG: ParB/RepB/Spo0J family partition protein [Bacteroidales bacterium]|nr:ParB/RepB/Spo0J family partition protein [Bacteroidales bacterium]HOK97874.1 ParB/RepB/Spo0J family partition protein [Bacteroidales bacterium]HPO64639.1 ParB/RepB/Spo0J family partition protein [Bacteroidales bacterium]
MNAKKNALGRGLGALIDDAILPKEIVQAVEASNEVSIDLIDVNPFQPRQDFDEEALEELAASIRQLGIIQPLTLRKLDNGRFQIIAGERRLRAAKIAGLRTVPAFLITTNDQGMLEMALVENIQRTDLNPIEIAISYQRLIDECNLTQETLSERVGKKRATVANYLRLLKLPPEIQAGIREEKISMGHAKALLAIDDVEQMIEVYHQIIEKQLSVREVEEMVRVINQPAEAIEPIELKTKAKEAQSQPTEYAELKAQLSQFFNSNVEFKRKPNGEGKIIITFKNDAELEKILSLLDSKKD